MLSFINDIGKLAGSAEHGWSDKAFLCKIQPYIELQLLYRHDIHTVDWKQSLLGYVTRVFIGLATITWTIIPCSTNTVSVRRILCRTFISNDYCHGRPKGEIDNNWENSVSGQSCGVSWDSDWCYDLNVCLCIFYNWIYTISACFPCGRLYHQWHDQGWNQDFFKEREEGEGGA